MANARPMFLAIGLATAIPALLAATPATAQISVSIGFDSFHSRLAPYGTWSNNSRWGEVWHPTRVASDFRPYYNGHWEDTQEYGWLWVSDESWGDITYHYGRWVFDPQEGWLWVPGYVWGPSWVVWRSGDGNIGWFPMPPGDNYSGDGAYGGNFDDEYGYRAWYGPGFDNSRFQSLWIFVGEDHFRDRDFRSHAVPQRDYGRFFSQTRDSTNYVTINNYVVNRSIDAARLQQNSKQHFRPVPARDVIGRNALVTQAAIGRQVEQRERQKHPIPAGVNPPLQRPDHSPAANGAVPANVQTPSPLPPGPAPSAEQATGAPRQIGSHAPSNTPGQRPDRNPAANESGQTAPQAPRVGPTVPPRPVTAAPDTSPPDSGQAGAQGRGNDRGPRANDVVPAKQQTPRTVPAARASLPVQTAPSANPPVNRGAQTNQQTGRFQPRAAPDQGGRGAAQAPGNAPVTSAQGGARTNPSQNRQGGAKKPDDQKGGADKKNDGGGRGQN